MLAVVITCIIVLPMVGLSFYAIRSKARLKVRAYVLKVVGFDIELGDQAGDEPGQLEQTRTTTDKTV